MFDLNNNYIDGYGFVAFNWLDYHNLLASINDQNTNPMTTRMNEQINLSSLLFNLNQLNLAYSNNNQSLNLLQQSVAMQPAFHTSLSPSRLNTLINLTSGPVQSNNEPVLDAKKSIENLETNNQSTCSKCKCSTYVVNQNAINKPDLLISNSICDSNLSSASFSSSSVSNGTRSSLSDDDVIPMPNFNPSITSTTLKQRVPRAITKTNDSIVKDAKSVDCVDRAGEPQKIAKPKDFDVLYPKLLAKTEQVFLQYFNSLTPKEQAKIDTTDKFDKLYKKVQPSTKARICYFCKNNGEPDYFYKTHIVRDPVTNETLCPVLFKYKCELCSATGKKSHTRSYCPVAKFMRENCENIEAARFFNQRILNSKTKKKRIALQRIEEENMIDRTNKVK